MSSGVETGAIVASLSLIHREHCNNELAFTFSETFAEIPNNLIAFAACLAFCCEPPVLNTRFL